MQGKLGEFGLGNLGGLDQGKLSVSGAGTCGETGGSGGTWSEGFGGDKGLVEIHGRIVRGTRTGFEGSAEEFFSRRRYFNLLQQHLSFGLMPEQVNQKTT